MPLGLLLILPKGIGDSLASEFGGANPMDEISPPAPLSAPAFSVFFRMRKVFEAMVVVMFATVG
jgi:hypothetical protein